MSTTRPARLGMDRRAGVAPLLALAITGHGFGGWPQLVTALAGSTRSGVFG